MKEYFEKFILIVIIVVVCSGLLIFVWNLTQGHNLSKSPQLDLSTFEPGGEFYDNWQRNNSIIEDRLVAQAEKKIQTQKELEQSNSTEIKKQSLEVEKFVYFDTSFVKDNVALTGYFLKSFLQEFPGLENVEIEYLQAFDSLQIKLPVEERENILNQFELNKKVVQAEVVEPPIWSLSLAESMSIGEINSLLNEISPKIEIYSFSKVYNPDYVAKIRYDNLENIEESLAKLKTEYSDVLMVD